MGCAMPARRFHLGWFLQGSSVQAWNQDWTGNIAKEWMYPEFFLELARSLERACFDYVLLEDSSYIGESYGGSRDIYLRNAISVPRQDPSVVASLMTTVTSKIGIVPTFGTFAYPPFLLARLMATLDQVSGGRIGWNMVTGSSNFAAQNYGLPAMPEHDLRYEMADEYMEVVNRLWASWAPDSMIADLQSGALVDPAKVHSIDFVGKYYSCRGPLTAGPMPQGRPVIAQAGGSPRGREFAATHADTIVASVAGVEGMKAYRDDVRARMARHGRDPDDCKVLFLVSPIVGDSEEDALRRKRRREEKVRDSLDERLAFMSKISNIDFKRFDLDAPVATLDLTTNGHQQLMDDFKLQSGRKTLRQAVQDYDVTGQSIEFLGSPEQVAEQMAQVVEAMGGDGFLFTLPDTSRRSLAEITDGLIPVLQRRGLVRTAYNFDHLRDNLLEF